MWRAAVHGRLQRDAREVDLRAGQVVEVVGQHVQRDGGHDLGDLCIAQAGIAGGAEYVLVPEVKYDLDQMCEDIKAQYAAGKRYSIIVIAEGAGDGMGLGKIVEEKTGIDTRVSVLGHIQRGGSPTVEDRMKASMLGEKAALALISGVSNVVFGFDAGKVVSINLFDAVNNQKTLDPELVRLARVLA